MYAIIRYGPPAGEDTVTMALTDLDARYVLFQRLKVRPGRRHGRRMTSTCVIWLGVDAEVS